MPVELVFIHGWGFDARFWDEAGALLPQFKQTRIDLGFFSAQNNDSLLKRPFPQGKGRYILVGHSLGFAYGFMQRQDWGGWIAINGFLRFVETASKPGCATAPALRDLRIKLQTDTAKTLGEFYRFIGAIPPAGPPHAGRLREGLDALRDADIGDVLAKLDVPGLALAGIDDPLVPLPASEALGKYARKGGFVLHETGGHLLPQADPAWCARMIDDFIGKCFG